MTYLEEIFQSKKQVVSIRMKLSSFLLLAGAAAAVISIAHCSPRFPLSRSVHSQKQQRYVTKGAQDIGSRRLNGFIRSPVTGTTTPQPNSKATRSSTIAPPSSAPYYWSESDDDDSGGEPNDFQIWSAIAKSLARWQERKTRKAHKSHVHRRAEEIVCYQLVGCFRDEGPFNYLDTLPQAPDSIGTQFWLFTREMLATPEPLRYDDNGTSLHRSHFNSSRPVKIIVHGFGSSGHRAWVKQMTDNLLHVENVNVVVVDWERGAALPNYVQAAANIQMVGRQISRIIEMLNVYSHLKNNDIHIIGFSLGAHVAGYAGMETPGLGRISGLDPASPLFEGHDLKVRLDPTDALFVDVIHTSGDTFLRGGLGASETMGHVDFYPNGGKFQPGCNSVFFGAITDIFYGNWQSLCNHRRSFKFFIDSIIRSCIFPASSCDSYDKYLQGECFPCKQNENCGHMGYYADTSTARGSLYLATKEIEPFCANQLKVSMVSTKGQDKTWGKLEVTFYSQDGINETILISQESQEFEDSTMIQGIGVSSPDFKNITSVTIRYNKYKGWIYSGKDEWALDKIKIENSHGNSFSYCGHRTVIKDNEPMTLPLIPKDCTDPLAQRAARFIWDIIADPIKGHDPRPPQLIWRLDMDDYEKYNWNKP